MKIGPSSPPPSLKSCWLFLALCFLLDLFSLILYEKVSIKDGSLHWPSDSDLNVSLVVIDLHFPVLNKSEYLSDIFPFLLRMLFWIAAVVNPNALLLENAFSLGPLKNPKNCRL